MLNIHYNTYLAGVELKAFLHEVCGVHHAHPRVRPFRMRDEKRWPAGVVIFGGGERTGELNRPNHPTISPAGTIIIITSSSSAAVRKCTYSLLVAKQVAGVGPVSIKPAII